MALVDDGLVDTEKMGTSVYFWSFGIQGETGSQAAD